VARIGDAGEALDPQARAAYKSRLDDLRSELDEARERNDPDRAAALQEEIDFITQELSAAYGLGGRARKGADSAERARKAVQSRVSDSISRIRKEHPALALHLSQSIRLGTFCTYVVANAPEWQF
jgi:ABC-type Zn uptake system ZnuABC Zn-binding protein ZnuA